MNKSSTMELLAQVSSFWHLRDRCLVRGIMKIFPRIAGLIITTLTWFPVVPSRTPACSPGIEFEPGLYVVEVALATLKVHPVYLLTSRSTFGSTRHLTEQSLQMLAFDRSALRSFTTRGQELRRLSFERKRGQWVRGDFEDYLSPRDFPPLHRRHFARCRRLSPRGRAAQ